MNQTDLQRLLARALEGDSKAHAKLTSLIIRSENKVWETIVNSCAVSTLEAVELAKLPPAISDADHIGLAPFVRVVRCESVQRRIAKRFKDFLLSLG